MAAPSAKPRETILVVDDDPEVLSMAVELRVIRPDVKILFMSAYCIQTVQDYLILLALGSRSWSNCSRAPS